MATSERMSIENDYAPTPAVVIDDAATISQRTSQSAFSSSAYSSSEYMNAPLFQGGSGDGGGSGFFRRIPCKARGVPGEHVAKNAYVDIPLNAKHGTVLSCSHPACRLSGRLFRFCSVCQVPVAKRNFARRHMHGLSSSEIALSTDAYHVPDESQTTSMEGSSPRKALAAASEASSSSSGKMVEDGKEMIPGEISIGQQRGLCGSSVVTNTTEMIVRELDRTGNRRKFNQLTTLEVTPDELDWLYLFRQKPGPKDSKEAWVRGVEKVAGFSFAGIVRPRKFQKKGEDDTLPEIEAPAEGLANFDVANIEDLFEE